MGEKLNAGDVCNRIVTVADRNMTLVQAAQLMRDHHVGCLVVADETGAGRLVVGMLTDRDIVTAVVAQEVDPATLRVEDVMTSDVVTALEPDSVLDLLGLMRRKGLRRIPVTTQGRVLLGLVTLDDLLQILAEQLRAMVLAIEAEQMRERRTRP
jgi:CBS domain-containing protein